MRRRLLARETKSLILYKATSLLEGTTCEQRAEVKRARLVRTGQEEVCFQCEDMSIRKQGEGLIPREIISCHSEDEIRRISISWEINANPCDSSLCSERQVLCHTALDAVSHKYSAFTSSPCDCGSESAMTIPILPLEVGATHVENLQAGIEMPSLFPLLEERQVSRVRKFFAKRIKFFEAKTVDTFNASLSRQRGRVRCQSAGFFAMISRHCEPRSGVAIQYLFQPNKILKQVQDDTIRNFRNELFNHSTLQLFNSCESSPHPSPLLKERERAWIFYTSLKDDCKKERENTITNLTPLSQCKTWRTLPC